MIRVQDEIEASFPVVVPPELPPLPAHPKWLRLAYCAEFLLALQVILSLWLEVGGAGHLDLMPWYVKLIGISGLAWCVVRLSAALVEQSKAATRWWLTAVLLIGAALGLITYYYHLHENGDTEGEESAQLSVRNLNQCVTVDPV